MNYSVINLKTDPELKQQAADVAKKLGISVSAVLNNELRRFVAEKTVTIEQPESINPATAKILAISQQQIAAGDYHSFDSNDDALEFLASELK